MRWIISLFVGALAGWIASRIMYSESGGLLRNILVGAVGGILGNWVSHLVGIYTVGLASFAVTIAGACLFIYLVRLVRGRA